jgi:GDP-L-fucose synthase
LTKNRKELDLTNQNKVYLFLKKNKPKFMIIAGAKVGGIIVNIKYLAEFIYQNIFIQCNMIRSAYLNNI